MDIELDFKESDFLNNSQEIVDEEQAFHRIFDLLRCCDFLENTDEFAELIYLRMASFFFVEKISDIDRLKEQIFLDSNYDLEYKMEKEIEIIKRFPFINK